jgi:phosphohistidine swiveling domain-containing protein
LGWDVGGAGLTCAPGAASASSPCASPKTPAQPPQSPSTHAQPRPQPPKTNCSQAYAKDVFAKGLAASPGAAVGKIVFTADAAEEAAKAGEHVILCRTVGLLGLGFALGFGLGLGSGIVLWFGFGGRGWGRGMLDQKRSPQTAAKDRRPARTPPRLPPQPPPQETSPEDVGGMHAAEGILTSRGGMTSHAAVVARGWGKPCVCGCEELTIDEKRQVGGVGARGFWGVGFWGWGGSPIHPRAMLVQPWSETDLAN